MSVFQRGSGLVLLVLTVSSKLAPVATCDTQSAICRFNGRLQGSILFYEKYGFGCSNYGDDEGLHVDIVLQGFDTRDRVTSHSLRIKSFAGLSANCTGMGPDFGQGLRGSDLGTFSEGAAGVMRVSGLKKQQGPWLSGQQSIMGRSVAVMRGPDSAVRQLAPEVLDCCIIGMANLQQQSSTTATRPSFSTSRPLGGTGLGRHSAASMSSAAGGRGAFGGSAFRSPFGLGDKLTFFDLSGKTARATSFIPNSLQKNFRAPEPPRFQDIYGLESGESPLSRSGYGNTVGPSKGSAFSRMFFQDQDIRNTVGLGLTAEDKDIPRESRDEESTRTFHEDKAVDSDPAYEDTPNNNDHGQAANKAPPETAKETLDVPHPAGSVSGEYGNLDANQASFLPSHDTESDVLNISVNQQRRNGQIIEGTAEGVGTTHEQSEIPRLTTNGTLSPAVPDGPFSGGQSGSVFASPFSSPSATSPSFFDLRQRDDIYNPSNGVASDGYVPFNDKVLPAKSPASGTITPASSTANRLGQAQSNQDQYLGIQNQNGNTLNQPKDIPYQYAQGRMDSSPLPGGSQILEGFSSFPAHTSRFDSPGGRVGGTGFQSTPRLGDLFFRGEDKNPAADLLETGLFDSGGATVGSSDSNRYRTFLDLEGGADGEGGSRSLSDTSPSYYDDATGNDYGNDYYDNNYPADDYYPTDQNGPGTSYTPNTEGESSSFGSKARPDYADSRTPSKDYNSADGGTNHNDYTGYSDDRMAAGSPRADLQSSDARDSGDGYGGNTDPRVSGFDKQLPPNAFPPVSTNGNPSRSESSAIPLGPVPNPSGPSQSSTDILSPVGGDFVPGITALETPVASPSAASPQPPSIPVQSLVQNLNVKPSSFRDDGRYDVPQPVDMPISLQ